MKAIVEYGPFSTMIDVVGDGRPIYFQKPIGLAPMPWSITNLDDVVQESMPRKLEFTHRTDIEYNGTIIQVYRFSEEG